MSNPIISSTQGLFADMSAWEFYKQQAQHAQSDLAALRDGLRQLEKQIEKHLDWLEAEGFIITFPNDGKKHFGGLGAVVDSSTAQHALLFLRADLKKLIAAGGDRPHE